MDPDAERLKSLECSDTRLTVTWGDGHVSAYPSVWLLEACACEACGSSATAVRHVRLTDKPPRPSMISAELENGRLVIDWGRGHRSRFAPAWLRAHCLSERERLRRKPAPQVWSGGLADRLPYMDYDRVAADPERHLAFLESLRDLGFAILRKVPTARARTEEVAGLVGMLRLTNYGIYELEAKPDPEIVGDMAVPLALHTDEPYRIEPPAITFFHVLRQSASGGESTLADGLHLARLLKDRDPQAFETLCRVPARFHRTLREGRAFEAQAPIIRRDADGEVTGVRLLDRGMAPVNAPLDQVEPFYDAVRAFLRLVYEGVGSIVVRLRPGEMLVFNNHRIMHGRTGFDPSQSHRHVRSCHVDLDEFQSRLRVLTRQCRGTALSP